MSKEIIPKAQASSIIESTQQNNNPDIAQMVTCNCRISVLFGAVYGVKRKVDDNSKLISINQRDNKKKFHSSNYWLKS